MARRGENIYKRKDGRYEGRYLKGSKKNGKSVFGYIYGYSYNEVKSKLIRIKIGSEDLCQIQTQNDGRVFSDFLKFWIENIIKNKIKQSTYTRYHERINGHILTELGKLRINKINSTHIQDFINSLSEKGLAPATVRGIYGLLFSSMKTALSMGEINTNPCEGIVLPVVKQKEARALGRGEQVKIENLAGQASQSIKLGCYISLYTGLRIGEVCALRWRDIDFDSGFITVSATVQRIKSFSDGEAKTEIIVDSPKSKQSLRRIPVPVGLLKILSEYGGGIKSDYYVLTNREKPTEPRVLRQKFKKITDEAGIDATFHALRHTYATRCLELNFDIQTVSELLGHSNAVITMKVYAHSVMEHKQMLVKRIFILSENIKPSQNPSSSLSGIG